MDRTNETSKGYTYNGQNFTNQTRTDSQGNSYTVAIPTAALSTVQTPITPVQPKVADFSGLASNATSYINNAALDATRGEEALQRQNEINLTNEKSGAIGALASMQSSMGGRGADQLAAYNAQDATGQSVNSLAGRLRAINAQSQALGLDTQAKTLAEQNKASGQNITAQAVQRNTADVTRENTINMARLAMESAIVNADYQTAKSYADQIVEAKYAQKTADIEAAKTNIENIRENLTTAQRKAADATLQRLKKEEQEQATKIANEKAIDNMLIEASPVAPKDILAKATEVKNKGGSAVQVAAALGVYGQDYLKNELLKEQIAKVKADRAETYAKMASLSQSAQNTIASNIANGTIQVGQLVSKSTGGVPKNISADKQDGILALKDLSKKVAEYSSIYESMGGAGLIEGIQSKVKPTSTQSQLAGLRSEIVDLLARARSGAALTAYETAQYEDKLPGAFNSVAGFGTQGSEKIKSLRSSIDGTLKTKLDGYGVTFASTPEEDYLDSINNMYNNTGTQSAQVSSYTQSLLTPKQ